jgi:hypothetical protein
MIRSESLFFFPYHELSVIIISTNRDL